MSSEEALLCILKGYERTTHKTYCYPSQDTILKRLEEYYQTKMSKRTLNRILKDMEGKGYICRKRRTTVVKGQLLFTTTLYRIGIMGYMLLKRLLITAKTFFLNYRLPNVANKLKNKEKKVIKTTSFLNFYEEKKERWDREDALKEIKAFRTTLWRGKNEIIWIRLEYP